MSESASLSFGSQNHSPALRPWGSFRSLEIGDGFQVKEIIVEPGQRLSLQSHEKRSEHWVVVRGPVRVTLQKSEYELQSGDHIFIPRRAKHRLGNPGFEPVRIIEIQLGDYLGEDDIIRYEDDYQRSSCSENPDRLIPGTTVSCLEHEADRAKGMAE